MTLSPNGEFFQAIRDGRTSIATGQIDHFTEKGIQLKNGKYIEADLIMLATGMNLQSNFPFSTMKVRFHSKWSKKLHIQTKEHLSTLIILISQCP